jgi:hypothetical protein
MYVKDYFVDACLHCAEKAFPLYLPLAVKLSLLVIILSKIIEIGVRILIKNFATP